MKPIQLSTSAGSEGMALSAAWNSVMASSYLSARYSATALLKWSAASSCENGAGSAAWAADGMDVARGAASARATSRGCSRGIASVLLRTVRAGTAVDDHATFMAIIT